MQGRPLATIWELSCKPPKARTTKKSAVRASGRRLHIIGKKICKAGLGMARMNVIRKI